MVKPTHKNKPSFEFKNHRNKKAAQAPVANTATTGAKENEGAIEGELFCLQALHPDAAKDSPSVDHKHPLQHLQEPQAMKASVDPNTMCMHKAMRQPGKEKFQEAMIVEVEDQLENDNFELVQWTDVPKSTKIFGTVWQMKRKMDAITREIKKCKARMNFDGSKMVQRQACNQLHSPVASWNSMRLPLTLASTCG